MQPPPGQQAERATQASARKQAKAQQLLQQYLSQGSAGPSQPPPGALPSPQMRPEQQLRQGQLQPHGDAQPGELPFKSASRKQKHSIDPSQELQVLVM